MKDFPIIYKRTATGAVQQWQAEIDGARYRTISGQLDSPNLQATEWVECFGTNVGKKNERTPEQQAIFEVNALYTKKLERDYHERIEDIDKPLIFAPMLAKEWGEYAEKIDFEDLVFAQPKLDGIRCIATARGLFSRNGKPLLGVPHIFEDLKPAFKKDPDLILDGELYNHEYKDDFNAIVSATKKQKPSAEDLEKARLIEYHVYDMPSVEGVFEKRYKALWDLLGYGPTRLSEKYIQRVQTIRLRDLDHAVDEYQKCVTAGYEGMMVRLNTPYANKRTSNLLKYKESMTEEFILEDIQPGVGNWSGKAKRAILRMENGETFAAGVAGPMEWCAQILAEKHLYVGNPTTVIFFAKTPAGVPRFGRVKEFNREDANPAAWVRMHRLLGNEINRKVTRNRRVDDLL